MKRTIPLILGTIFLVVGCQSIDIDRTQSVSSSVSVVSNHLDLAPFTSIVIGGDVRAELVNGSPGIDVKRQQEHDYGCPYSVINHVLYIDNLSYDTKVKISAPELKKIIVIDHATLSANNFKTGRLNITAKGYGVIELKGKYDLGKIRQFGYGKIYASWVNSQSLSIESDAGGPIYLAGRADNLIVKITKDALLYASFLRAKKAYVFATDQASAEILALDTLGAFAVDRSSVHYYKRPKELTVVTRNSGRVLYSYNIQ